jgi:hypothetical protein
MAGLFGITSGGKKTPIYRSNKGATVGVKDPNTGQVFKHPRNQLNGGIVQSAHVKVTNPKALDSAQVREANRSKVSHLGQGGV